MAEKNGFTVKVYRNIMSSHGRWTKKIRELLSAHNTVMVNIIGSPGSGKTALLEALLPHFMRKKNVSCLRGCETDRDARDSRQKTFRRTDRHAGACHLSAQTICNVLQELDLSGLDFVFVENVGTWSAGGI